MKFDFVKGQYGGFKRVEKDLTVNEIIAYGIGFEDALDCLEYLINERYGDYPPVNVRLNSIKQMIKNLRER